MANILAVGIATLDILNQVATYPNEDDEIRALSQHYSRGGNATNTLAILSQLQHQCYWAGTLAEEANTAFILNDLETYQIDYSWVDFVSSGKIPTSYINISAKTGSRTIIHYRDLAEYSASSFRQIPLEKFDWIHFEGRNIGETEQMLQYCRNLAVPARISIEIEKNRPGIDKLFKYADLLLFSKPYAQSLGFRSMEEFLLHMANDLSTKQALTQHSHSKYAASQQAAPSPSPIISCTWGASGASLYAQQKIHHNPGLIIAQPVNTLAAGDTYNAALINALWRGYDLPQCLHQACQLAAQKCAAQGLDFITNKT